MPREQVDGYLVRPDSPGVLDYDIVRDYMTSTLFAQLVANGYVGTSGASSDLVKQEIDSALNRRGAVVVGAFSNTSGRRPSWRGSGRMAGAAQILAEPSEPDELM